MRNSTYWFCLMLFLVYGNMQSQQSFIDLNDLIQHQEKHTKSSMMMIDAEEVQDLIYNIHPTIYIDQNGMQTYGKSQPVIVEINFDDIQLLSNDSSFQNIKILKITAPSLLKGKMPSNLLELFPNLKYIYFLCHNNCNLTALKNLYPNSISIPTIYQFATAE